jgi:hypothetical protein
MVLMKSLKVLVLDVIINILELRVGRNGIFGAENALKTRFAF